jgi:hypothetical protein
MAVFWVAESLIALMMEAISTSETSVNCQTHGATTQETAVFILAAVRT